MKNKKLFIGGAALAIALVLAGGFYFANGEDLQGRFNLKNSGPSSEFTGSKLGDNSKTSPVNTDKGPGRELTDEDFIETCDDWNHVMQDGECVEVYPDIYINNMGAYVDSSTNELVVTMHVQNIGDGEGIMAEYEIHYQRFFQSGSGGGTNTSDYNDDTLDANMDTNGQVKNIRVRFSPGEDWITELEDGYTNQVWLTGAVDTTSLIDEEDESNNTFFGILELDASDIR